ncbi:unnamed protein product [Peniophora sp. CBMAI 1063]|nr:unnamed protein product [Peniophora sp. CBMAI 1063]
MDEQPDNVEGQAVEPPEEPVDTTSSTSESSEADDVDAAERAYASYGQTWDLAHLETAIAQFQRAVDTAPVPTAYPLGELGHCLHLYYEARGNVHDLQRAIAAEQSALQLVPDGHPGRALRLNNLSTSFRKRFESLGTVEDLESAIEMQQHAVELTPDDHPDLSAYLDNLGGLLWLHFQHFGKLEDLESAIASHQRATGLTPDDHLRKATRLHNLAASLRRRFERLDDPADLERAITIQRCAVKLTPDDHPNLPVHLDTLGSLHHLRFLRFGKLEDLESAIASHQRATELTPDDHPDKASRLHNLALSLRSRFQRLDDPADLERAITIQHRAIELTPDAHPDLPKHLDNLGGLQEIRFQRFGKLENLESAIASQQRATELTPDNHLDKATRLHHLALSLRSRFGRLDDPADLERAITIQRHAVDLTPDGHPGLPRRLDNFGSLQWASFRHFGKLEDLEGAIVDQRRAVNLTVDNLPDKAMRLHNLAFILMIGFRRERTIERFNEALSYYIAAFSQTLASPAGRLRIATQTIKFLNETPEFSTAEMLLSAHSHVLDVLSEVVWLGHTMERRLEESQKLGQLVSSAVGTAIGVDALEQAVEWLDAGRGLIWTQTMSLRSPLHELEQLRPDLAHALEDVHVQLQSSICASDDDDAVLDLHDGSLTGIGRTRADRQRGLAIKHGKLLSDIREVEGFDSFMLPKKLPALLPSSTRFSGIIIFINIDHVRCDALALSADGAVKVVPLPKLSLEKATDLRVQWLSYLDLSNARERGTLRDQSTLEHDGTGRTASARRILGRIWRWIVLPVLQGLGLYEHKEPLPHVTWCPTGPLAQLPLHAAGVYEDSGHRVYDFVVSSYTPSLSALTRSVNAVADHPPTPNALVVTQSDVPDHTSLPGTLVEGERIQEVLMEFNLESSVLTGNTVSKAAVRSALNKHSWLHLACHGTQNREDPLQSAFALHGGSLSLSDLMNTRADNAELAFLSACQTAAGDEKVPEESMHLAAGMLAVGYKGVIATMWSIDDNSAPLVVEAYYRKLLQLRASGTLGKGETGAAYALHEATRRLREEVGDKKFAHWAPFVHFGI